MRGTVLMIVLTLFSAAACGGDDDDDNGGSDSATCNALFTRFCERLVDCGLAAENECASAVRAAFTCTPGPNLAECFDYADSATCAQTGSDEIPAECEGVIEPKTPGTPPPDPGGEPGVDEQCSSFVEASCARGVECAVLDGSVDEADSEAVYAQCVATVESQIDCSAIVATPGFEQCVEDIADAPCSAFADEGELPASCGG